MEMRPGVPPPPPPPPPAATTASAARFIGQRRRANHCDRGCVAAQHGELAGDPRLAAVDAADLVPAAVGALAEDAQRVGLRHQADLAVVGARSLACVDVVLGRRQERHRRRRRCGCWRALGRWHRRVRRRDGIGGRRGRRKRRRSGNRRVGRRGHGCLGGRRRRQRLVAAAGGQQQAECQHAQESSGVCVVRSLQSSRTDLFWVYS